MPAVNSQAQKSFTYPDTTQKRAERALRCSPFKLSLFEQMLTQRVAMSEISGSNGLKNNFTKRTLSELAADNALVWLIEVGLLRREVDGQGITDSFRLTPLGHQLTQSFQNQEWAAPTLGDRLLNALTRIFRLPF
ncbi:MAG: Npun_F0494 family protein [Rivularia sp. (in: cyanobacteria)]